MAPNPPKQTTNTATTTTTTTTKHIFKQHQKTTPTPLPNLTSPRVLKVKE